MQLVGIRKQTSDGYFKSIENLPPPQEPAARNVVKFRRDSTGRYSIIDAVRIATGKKSRHASEFVKTVVSQYPEIRTKITYCQFSGERQRKTPVCDVDTVKQIIKILLASCRMTQKQQRSVIEVFCLDSIKIVKICPEANCIEIIRNALVDYDPVQQFHIYKYRVDLFIMKLNIVVECDEHEHASYDEDTERTATITDLLNCRWVRFDPYSNDFCVGHVICKIMRMI